ncbi:MAG: ATP-grasp domain-containing protein [Planctomycetes bacterium]|nr:ATP-grasp domain-containing protein [Planctomycetota bacterium]
MTSPNAPGRPGQPLFRRVLVANRGEIALRVIRTAKEMGIESVAVYSDADRNAMHVRRADRAVRIGPPPPRESYLRGDLIIEAARGVGADCIHPGYGFLSENAAFSQLCLDAGITFLGPSPHAIRAMGDKVEARRAAKAAKVPLVPGLEDDVKDDSLLAATAAKIGYPVMLKAAAGGGGKGIRIVRDESGLLDAARLARAEAKGAFGDDRIYLEKFVTRPRHVEVQVMGDRHGKVVAWGERECSVQRRHQKLVEESPSPAIDASLRKAMCEAACRLSRAVDYVGAGTVEFLASGGEYYFLEMNTRLQVEHPVTEMRFGVDLVREQFRVAAGLPATDPGEPRGHAIEIRVNAEDPETWFPALGTVRRLATPGGPGVRLDAALYRGLEVTPHYDSMLAKLIVWAEDRPAAIQRAIRALRELRIVGVTTSTSAALKVLQSDEFRGGDYDTGILERVDRKPSERAIELASLAAAVGKLLASERIGEETAGSPARQGVPNWVLVDRMRRLGGRLH